MRDITLIDATTKDPSKPACPKKTHARKTADELREPKKTNLSSATNGLVLLPCWANAVVDDDDLVVEGADGDVAVGNDDDDGDDDEKAGVVCVMDDAVVAVFTLVVAVGAVVAVAVDVLALVAVVVFTGAACVALCTFSTVLSASPKIYALYRKHFLLLNYIL